MNQEGDGTGQERRATDREFLGWGPLVNVSSGTQSETKILGVESPSVRNSSWYKTWRWFRRISFEDLTINNRKFYFHTNRKFVGV